MAKKTAKYTLSRTKIVKKLDDLVNKLSELDFGETTPNDLDSFLSDISNELSDLAFGVEEKA